MKKVLHINQSYHQKVDIRTTQEAAFKALTSDINQWWGAVDKPKLAEGVIFKVSWGEPWYQFKIIEYVPNHKTTWECVDANQIIDGLEGVAKEWVGTKLFWTIETAENGSIQINLTHQGLVPTIRCYEFCATTWDRFITEVLKHYLESK